MNKKLTVFVILFSVLLTVSAFSQMVYSTQTLTLDDLPDVGESLVITSDSTLTVDEGETAVISNATLQINGTDNAIVGFEIINNGQLTIDLTSIRCTNANLTITNTGTLTLQSTHFYQTGNSTSAISNNGTCILDSINVQVYGGHFYLYNTDSLTITNGYFKDQFDGTFFANYAQATMSECTFVANGAEGKIELFNSGDLQITHGTFDVNYGGKVNLNSLSGPLTMTECNVDVSGASHGTKSQINILGDNATWESCSFVNNDGTINYLNTGEVAVTDCAVYNYGVGSSTILSSTGPMTFENFALSGSGSTTFTSWESMTLIDSNFNCSHSLTLMNNGELTAENWLVKTTTNTARVTIYNGNNATLKFNKSFIEDVSAETLTAINSEGQEFVESSGGIITVTNNGSIAVITTGASSSEYLFYIVIIVVSVGISLFLIMRERKKQRETK